MNKHNKSINHVEKANYDYTMAKLNRKTENEFKSSS